MLWQAFADREPDLATDALQHFENNPHLILGTSRRDGSIRLSAVEAHCVDGNLRFGSMPGSPKSRDLRRRSACALHSSSAEPAAWAGDAKVAGRALLTEDSAAAAAFCAAVGHDADGEFDLFTMDVDEVVVIALNESRTAMVVRTWTPHAGVRRQEIV